MTADRSTEADPRSRALAEARAWIGTPYCHQASCRGAGTDCLGLIRGIWRALYGAEPEQPPAYSADWAEAGGAERLACAAARHLVALDPVEAMAGDVLLFRMRACGPAKHLAILASPGIGGGSIIHAYSGHAVCETRLTPSWTRRIAGAFRFPDHPPSPAR